MKGDEGRFWSKNVRCLRYRRQRGSPPSGVAPACPRCTWGLSKGRLGPVIPRALGHCVPVSQTVTQAGQGSGQGLAWGSGENDSHSQGGPGIHSTPPKLHLTSPDCSPIRPGSCMLWEQPGRRSRVAIHPTAVNQRDDLSPGPGAGCSPAAAPGAPMGHRVD